MDAYSACSDFFEYMSNYLSGRVKCYCSNCTVKKEVIEDRVIFFKIGMGFWLCKSG